ncbi:MAG TPA: hypothetical protein VIK15_05075 [Candidatus Anoxymicrobiaceae bacterium]
MSEIGRLLVEDDAQTTAEYALVILGGAAVASALIAWAECHAGRLSRAVTTTSVLGFSRSISKRTVPLVARDIVKWLISRH